MSVDLPATEQNDPTRHGNAAPSTTTDAPAANASADNNDNDNEEEEEESEPKLKYAKLTGSLTNVYRNGDSTSVFGVAGDKMVLGTHNGNIHVLRLPSLQSLRTYHAHSATITSVSVSPTPPPPSAPRATSSDNTAKPPLTAAPTATTAPTNTSSPRTPRAQHAPIPNTPSNAIYIATSSLDGHVCISSLLDPKDVQLRNFARPVQAVALSPQYKSDHTYLSGGLSGQLILTVGGKAGVTVDANTSSTAAAATSGFLGAFGLRGLAGDKGTDSVLHGGEGAISAVKWSWSGKWVCWVNEEGVKIMRSHLLLGSENEEDAWKRIAHAARPNRRGWEEMAGVWRGRVEWVDERKIEGDEEWDVEREEEGLEGAKKGVNGAVVDGTVKKAGGKRSKVEKLVVGWGDTAWILHVTEGGTKDGKKVVGSADIVQKMIFRDCIVSGISLYTPSLLAILAYRTRDDNDKPIQQPPPTSTTTNTKSTDTSSTATTKKGRIRNRQTGLAPQLRLVNISTTSGAEVGEEVDVDELSISRFETLSAQDYHMSTLFIPPPPVTPSTDQAAATEKGAFEGIWENTRTATRLFSSAASVQSSRSSDGTTTAAQSLSNGTAGKGSASVTSPGSSVAGVLLPPALPANRRINPVDAHPYAAAAGLKLFIQSPYDCVLAVKRDLGDHLKYLLNRRDYARAWGLVDKYPEVVDATRSDTEARSQPGTPARRRSADAGAGGQTSGSLADFFADETGSPRSSLSRSSPNNTSKSLAGKEKRRIGDLWLQQLVSSNQYTEAARIAPKVLGKNSKRWEHWILTFAQAQKFDDIVPHIPSDVVLPSVVYEVILGHYIAADPARAKELMEQEGGGWEPERGLYDDGSVIAAVESRLGEDGDVEEGGEEWRILTEILGLLYLADGRAQEALNCYIRVQNAEKAMRLLEQEKLMDVIAVDDVPGLLMLRLSKEQMRSAPLDELEEASREVVKLLVEEALGGRLMPDTVIRELLDGAKGRNYLRPFLFFYLKGLWRGTEDKGKDAQEAEGRRGMRRRYDRMRVDEGQALVEDHADLAVELFAEYDRDLLMTFLRASEVYNYEKAATLCEQRDYIPELVYVLSKTGQTKRALQLIISQLGDVKQAILFAKDNPDLWDDLLDYSMDKPAFIKGLLEEVGTAIDPVQLVRRIPEGLEIEGLKDGIAKMMREYDIQFSISEGVARVLRGEVSMGMDTLRAGQKKGVKFEVVHESEASPREVELAVVDPVTKGEGGEGLPVKQSSKSAVNVEPGRCVGCGEVFSEDEKEILIGFACGHVYHLSCLLQSNSDTADDATLSTLQSQLGSNAGADDGYTGRSVGAKVAHAHTIKNVLKGGCRYCHRSEDA